MGQIIGIDLGTTNSEIAVLNNGRPEVIPVEGKLIMPSCVGIDSHGELIVGTSARNQMVSDPDQTVLSIKRKMGQDIITPLGKHNFSPEEISSFILKKLKEQAEEYLGEEVTQAVITVPAYFNDSQRKATKNAGILAGLEVMRIFNEPTAAALAYEADQEDNQTILIYDLGGGTFDVSLVVVENGVVEVKASHGNNNLGGDDFDNLIMEHVADLFLKQHEIDLLNDLQPKMRLLSAVILAKEELSDSPFARISEEFIIGDKHLDVEISRHDYEEMIKPLIKTTMKSVQMCLKDGDLLPKDIDKIILVGGATRTPLISEMINELLKCEAHHEISPDLIVAMGAAIQGGVMSGEETHSVLVDISPYTFGTAVVDFYEGELQSDIFTPIIKRNSALPVSKADVFNTIADGQKQVNIRIYQGEEPIVTENIFIGNFLIEDLGDFPAGNEIVLNLHLNLDGVLEVTALEKRTGLTKTVNMDTGAGKKSLDLDLARENINQFLGDMPVDSIPSVRHDSKEMSILDAKDLRKRALALMDEIDETDAEELKMFLDESKKSIKEGNIKKLVELNESLSDVLFYLED